MMGKRAVLTVAVVTLLAGSGCVCCRPEASRLAYEAGPDTPLPACERQKVYAFLVNGLTPTGMSGLVDQLNAQGFPKVAYGQLCHAVWMGQEMRRIHTDDADARFIIIGYDLGGMIASRLASDAIADGLPVDALVLLDPVGKSPVPGCPVRTVLVCSGVAKVPMPHTECVPIPDAGHFSLPTHPQTVAVVCRVLQDSAGNVTRAAPEREVMWTYEHAPTPLPRPLPAPNADPKWTFLLDVQGSHTTPLLPATPEVSPANGPIEANPVATRKP